MTNTRSKESMSFNSIWKDYVNIITTSRDSRRLIDEEHLVLAKLMFNTLTSRDSNPKIVESFKTFLSTSIDYVYVCEKANWTLYIIVFIFKINSMILNLCNSKSVEDDYNSIKHKVDSNILDSIDTLRTSSMIFKILSTCKDDTFTYSNEIFGIASYFCTKLLFMRTKSVQDKFLGFFKNDSTSQHFFKQCSEYIQVHMEKLQKGSLKFYYSQQKYTDELSRTCYLVDKNLEKQVLTLLRLFCANDNREMQNYLRDQTNSTKSYNMVTLVTNYASEFITHLHYPVAFDTFKSAIDALLEFVQGPNRTNQDILIQHHFVDLANAILNLDYNQQEIDIYGERGIHKQLSKQLSVLDQMPSIRPSVSIKESAKHKFDISSEEITQPSNNFMTSLIKYKCLQVLLQLLVGRSPTSYIYYLYRRVLEPRTFRLNFAYQSYFLEKFHKDEYRLELFFRYDQHIDSKVESPMIIEVGFYLYFLLMRMQENLIRDYDDKYYKYILKLLSQRNRSSSNVQNNTFISFWFFLQDVYNI